MNPTDPEQLAAYRRTNKNTYKHNPVNAEDNILHEDFLTAMNKGQRARDITRRAASSIDTITKHYKETWREHNEPRLLRDYSLENLKKNSYMMYSTQSEEPDCDEGRFKLLPESSLPRYTRPPLDYFSAKFPNTTEKTMSNGKTLYLQWSDLEPANYTYIILGDSRIRSLIDSFENLCDHKVQWILAAVSGGWSNCITAAFQELEGFISGQRINLMISFGINDFLSSSSGINIELLVSRILTQAIDITRKRKIYSLIITSIIPSVGFEDACIKADFLLHLLGKGRFQNAAFVQLSRCFIIENRNQQMTKYRINKAMYGTDGIHFSPKGRKVFKVIIKHWLLRMTELQEIIYDTKSSSKIYLL
jgi:hypothetical protein